MMWQYWLGNTKPKTAFRKVATEFFKKLFNEIFYCLPACLPACLPDAL